MNCLLMHTCSPASRCRWPRQLLVLAICLFLSGCAREAQVYGIRPIYPEARLTFSNSEVAFVPVESRQPTLRWEPFPPPNARTGEDLPSLTGPVTYEVRIWRAATEERPAELVYKREGLPEPNHRLERILEPATRYFWTVRARLPTADGYRVSEWSRPQHRNLRRSNIVPEVAWYRFETPAAGP